MTECPDCGNVEAVKATAIKRVDKDTTKEVEKTVCPDCNQEI